MKTTLNAIKEKAPCVNGYRKLLKFLGKTEADDEELDVLTILESNGLEDTIWCFRVVSGYETEKRMFAVFCARQVQHLITDKRSINCIEVSERYANGNATAEELKVARDAADDAARANDDDAARIDAAYSAYSASRAADAFSAAYSAARAAYSAACAADDAADAAARAAHEAARDTYPNIMSVSEAYLKELLSEAEK